MRLNRPVAEPCQALWHCGQRQAPHSLQFVPPMEMPLLVSGAEPVLVTVTIPFYMVKRILTLCAVAAAVYAQHTPVLLVSVDGLRPDYLLRADHYGLKIPHLRRMLAEGAYARGFTACFQP